MEQVTHKKIDKRYSGEIVELKLPVHVLRGHQTPGHRTRYGEDFPEKVRHRAERACKAACEAYLSVRVTFPIFRIAIRR